MAGKKFIRFVAFICSMALVSAGCAGKSDSGGGGDGDAFYAGKTIELIVPSAPGGANDLAARLGAQYLEKYIPGNPTVQVVNIEGGGQIQGGNEFIGREADGTSLLLTGPSGGLAMAVGHPEVRYHAKDMHALWTFNRGNRVMFVNPDTGVETVEDLKNPPNKLFMGTTTVVGSDLPLFLMLESLGLLDTIEVIFGYESAGGTVQAAYDAGEVNFDTAASQTYLNSVDGGTIDATALFTAGELQPDGSFERDSVLPDLPDAEETFKSLKGTEPSGESWEAFKTILDVVGNGGFTLWNHAEDPENATADLQTGIKAITEDDEYITKLQDILGPFQPGIGAYAEAYGERVANIDPHLIDWIATWAKDRFDVNLTE